MSAPNLRATVSRKILLAPVGASTDVATFCLGCGASAAERRRTRQAATSNSEAMNRAWSWMSRLAIVRTCLFLIIAIAS